MMRQTRGQKKVTGNLRLLKVSANIGLIGFVCSGAIVGRSIKVLSQTDESPEVLSYFCGTSNGVPTTFIGTTEGKFPIITWHSQYFANTGYPPERRCQVVSQRLQNFFETGQLVDLVPGVVNNQPVVCVSVSRSGLCSGVLFVVEGNEDPSEIIEEFRHILPNRNDRNYQHCIASGCPR